MRWAVSVAALLAFAIAAVAYGRSEGRHATGIQRAGLLEVRAAVGRRLSHPGQSVYDSEDGLQCLLYGTYGNPLENELCFDSTGGLVEAVDRNGPEQIWSVRWDRAQAPFSITPAKLEAAVQNVPEVNRQTGLLP
jgi:hypothetical protein